MTDCRTGPGRWMQWLRRCLGCVVALSLLMPAAARAEALAGPDARAVRQVVEAQLEAFAAGDAERAFSYASASIQAQFGNANNFLAMVRRGYPMVVGPSAVSFFQAQAQGGTERPQMPVRQAVQVRDRDGRLWMATYLLERQAGVGWRISGCMVVAVSAKALT